MSRIGCGDRVGRFGIQLRTLCCQHSTFYLKVITEGISNEVDRVIMPRFEIDMMDVLSTGTEDDSADTRPKTRHGAHAARLQCAVEGISLQVRHLQPLAGSPDHNHLGMRCWIVPKISFIEADADNLAVSAGQNCPNLRSSRSLSTESGLPQGKLHVIDVPIRIHFQIYRAMSFVKTASGWQFNMFVFSSPARRACSMP